MNLNEIPTGRRTAYEEECRCGNKFTILTQNGLGHSEYDTEIYLRCPCGEYVEFILPVNQMIDLLIEALRNPEPNELYSAYGAHVRFWINLKTEEFWIKTSKGWGKVPIEIQLLKEENDIS